MPQGSELVFRNIAVSIEKRKILNDINGLARPGEMLAIMGPSGSGKTTLLNCLAGRRSTDSGEIAMNSQPLTKQVRRKISYVLQQDIFLPQLTCWQTIWSTAMLRLPGSMPAAEKEQRVYEIIDDLDMKKCLHTKIGNELTKGLSGGEKKRTTIACEMLTNPSLMLLDEPTSGLDSSTSFSLCSTMKRFAKKSGKTVIMTIHQPSSQIFYMFDKLLLLCEGQVAYYGDMEKCADYFRDMELPCPVNYNLADHILDLVKGESELKERITNQASVCLRTKDWYPAELRDGTSVGKSTKSSNTQNLTSFDGNQVYDNGGRTIPSQTSGKNGKSDHTNESFAFGDDSEGEVKFCGHTAPVDDEEVKYEKEYSSTWPTSFAFQYSVLVRRSFRQLWPSVLSKWNMLQLSLVALIKGLIWFQIDANEENVKDRNGLVILCIICVSFFAIIDATYSVSNERAVLNKERLAGYYRLSAHCLAKFSCELPLVLVASTMHFTIVYWLAGLNYSFAVYLQSLCVIGLSVTLTQGIGGCFSSLLLDDRLAITCAIIIMLSSMITSGFYTSQLPFWATWIKYLSFVTHIYNAVLHIQYTNTNIRCAETSTRYLACGNSTVGKASMAVGNMDTELLNFIPTNELLAAHTLIEDGWQFWHHIIYIVGCIVIFRFLTYLVLRFIRKPHLA